MNQGCGSVMFLTIPDFFPSRISDASFFHPGSRTRIQEFKYINPKKWFLSSRKYDSSCSSRIPDTGSGSWLFMHPGSRGQEGTGSATLLWIIIKPEFFEDSFDGLGPLDAGPLVLLSPSPSSPTLPTRLRHSPAPAPLTTAAEESHARCKQSKSHSKADKQLTVHKSSSQL